jgi:hypothetical protein
VFKVLFLLLAVVAAALVDVHAQEGLDSAFTDDAPAIAQRTWKLERGAKETHFEFGFAPMQPTFFSGKKEYDTDGRKLALHIEKVVEEGEFERLLDPGNGDFVDLGRRRSADGREAGYWRTHGSFASRLLLAGLCKIRAVNSPTI